jgi:hypothetical protein
MIYSSITKDYGLGGMFIPLLNSKAVIRLHSHGILHYAHMTPLLQNMDNTTCYKSNSTIVKRLI